MGVNRKFKEVPLQQGADEQVPYNLTTTPWGSSPSSPVCQVMVKGGSHDSSLLSTSVCTISGDVITTGKVKNLQVNAEYELQIKFTTGDNVFEAYGAIEVEN